MLSWKKLTSFQRGLYGVRCFLSYDDDVTICVIVGVQELCRLGKTGSLFIHNGQCFVPPDTGRCVVFSAQSSGSRLLVQIINNFFETRSFCFPKADLL